MLASWLAAFWLGLIAPASLPEAREDGGEVIVDVLEVLVEPDEAGYTSGDLKGGDRLVVARGSKPGWLAIRPPAAAFDWIDSATIRDQGDGTGIVIADRGSIRSGAEGALMPGPPCPFLAKGASVRLLDRPPLRLGQGAKARTWRAIAPPEGEIRYVRRDGVRLDPIPTSKLDDPRVRPAQVDRGGAGGDPVAKFEEALRRSRAIDNDVDATRRTLALARTTGERGYDAKGMLQASARKVEGQRVHALIGPEGTPVAYLAIPPGIPAARLLTRKVGVRGEVHFNEVLGARLITVKDLDPLDRPR